MHIVLLGQNIKLSFLFANKSLLVQVLNNRMFESNDAKAKRLDEEIIDGEVADKTYGFQLPEDEPGQVRTEKGLMMGVIMMIMLRMRLKLMLRIRLMMMLRMRWADRSIKSSCLKPGGGIGDQSTLSFELFLIALHIWMTTMMILRIRDVSLC